MRLGRHGILGNHRFERNSPSVIAEVGLWNRDLLLPSSDTHHHPVVWHRIRFYIKEIFVLSILDRFELRKGLKCLSDCGLARNIGNNKLYFAMNWRCILVDLLHLRHLSLNPLLVQDC